MELSPIAANRLSAILEERTGQQLSGARRWRLETLLQPVLRAFGCQTLEMLAMRAARDGGADGAALRVAVAEALLNNETSFFRDRAAFDHVRRTLLPALGEARRAVRRLRIWSAGCSTGQEAHSLAMLVADDPRWQGWMLELVATDVSGAALARAREGIYAQMEVQRGLAIGELLQHFTPEGDAWRVKPAILAQTRFIQSSLLEGTPPGLFDLILCRNVLLYLSEARRADVFARLAGALAPDGLLVLGAGETVLGQTEAFRPDSMLRGCYRRADAQATGAAGPGGAMPTAA